jgi:hypothetical protein
MKSEVRDVIEYVRGHNFFSLVALYHTLLPLSRSELEQNLVFFRTNSVKISRENLA